MVWGSGFRVQGSGFRVQGLGFRVQGAGFRVQGAGFRVQGRGFRVQGLGFYLVAGAEVEAQDAAQVLHHPLHLPRPGPKLTDLYHEATVSA